FLDSCQWRVSRLWRAASELPIGTCRTGSVLQSLTVSATHTQPGKSSSSSTEESALSAILESTAAETGERYFAGLVQRLAQVMNTCGAWVTEYNEEKHRLRAMAFWLDGGWIDEYDVALHGTPCDEVIKKGSLL